MSLPRYQRILVGTDGLLVKALTTFIEGSPVAQFIKTDLHSRGIACEGREVPQGGP